MSDKLALLLKSRRFWVAVGGVVEWCCERSDTGKRFAVRESELELEPENIKQC